MTNFGFHVTHKSNVDSIRGSGISAKTTGSWRKQRKQFRKQLDTALEGVISQYVPRQNSVFMWTKIPDADEYIRTAFTNPSDYVIVTVDLSQYTTWTVDNQLIEQLFERWINEQRSSLTQKEVEEFRESAEIWNGKQKSRFEVWCDSPIDPSDITDIQ